MLIQRYSHASIIAHSNLKSVNGYQNDLQRKIGCHALRHSHAFITILSGTFI